MGFSVFKGPNFFSSWSFYSSRRLHLTLIVLCQKKGSSKWKS